ncbi:hypothetical protein [Companilactobacillus futsaii]|uniref:2-hydroxymuconic semialdehyde hydrolase n=1 Tax=Companilactobacillus futsaii TaxID=938155 RepID=A0A5B7T0A5_9LACO|nr:hypothetical protein [Companilactobacillus futsaii]QCX23999.1 2-hydroxymuconic semialdehyde hydrolase [Companilactobacillus futsaii]
MSEIFKIESLNDVFNLPESEEMLSTVDDRPNITKDVLIHLLKGGPVVDLSDGEYIHWLQLDKSAIDYINNLR